MIEPTTPFGRTGHDSTRIIFGAAALGAVTQDEADQTMELIRRARHQPHRHRGQLRRGRAAARAVDGRPPRRVLPGHQDRRADRPTAYEEIQRSLERLRTDHVDLIQLHNLVDEDEWQTAFAAGGALEAAVQARDEGLVRYIGVTGHGVTVARPAPALAGAVRVRLGAAALQLPDDPQRGATSPTSRRWRPLCAERGVAVQTIKSITRAPWGDREQTAATWYEPLTDQGAIDTAVAWVLGREGVFLNTVGDIHVLPQGARRRRAVPTAGRTRRPWRSSSGPSAWSRSSSEPGRAGGSVGTEGLEPPTPCL